MSCNPKNGFDSPYTLIIPQNGCPGCVNAGKKIALAYKDNECLTVVFTGITDLKKLKIEMGYDYINSYRVIADVDNKFQETVSSYPVFFQQKTSMPLDNFELEEKLSKIDSLLQTCK
jgi:hypothetical protein